MKNILLPTDFSENSMNAINYAMHFFENWECNFYILNVQKVSSYISDDLATGSQTNSVYESIASDNKRLISQLVKKLKKQYKSQSYTFHGLFDYDDFIAAVDQAVKFHAINLVIMGTNGATGSKEILFGSNTLQVIRNIECPTLTIPEHFKYSNIKKVLFSTLYNEVSSFRDSSVLKEILNMHHCEFSILKLENATLEIPKEEDNTHMKRLFKEYPYNYYSVHTSSGFTALNIATQLLSVDLEAVLLDKETFLERLLFGSETSQLTYNTRVPLLFLHH